MFVLSKKMSKKAPNVGTSEEDYLPNVFFLLLRRNAIHGMILLHESFAHSTDHLKGLIFIELNMCKAL